MNDFFFGFQYRRKKLTKNGKFNLQLMVKFTAFKKSNLQAHPHFPPNSSFHCRTDRSFDDGDGGDDDDARPNSE